MKRIAASLAFASALTAAADRPPPALLEPNGPWVIEAQDALCMLTRSYGTDPAKVTIGLQPLFTTPTMEVFVITSDRSRDPAQGEATVAFAPSEITVRGSYLSSSIGGGRRLTRLTLPFGLLDQVESGAEMTLSAGQVTAKVRLVRARAGLAALDRCQHDLLRSWHVDESALAKDRAPIALQTSLPAWRYPTEAMRLNIQGRVIAALNVSAEGRATDCRVVVSVHQTLDKQTCAVAPLIRFQPGRDSEGRPAPSLYLLPVRWVLP